MPLVEGQVNEWKLEVTSEDGTIRHYVICVKRLSAKDATLSGLKVSPGELEPGFDPDVVEYSCRYSYQWSGPK